MNQPSLFSSPRSPQQRSFDVCIRRAKHNPQSVAANPTDGRKESQRTVILNYIKSRLSYGATSAEIEQDLKLAKNKFSGRLTELRDEAKLIVANGVRQGCTVYVHKSFTEVAQ